MLKEKMIQLLNVLEIKDFEEIELFENNENLVRIDNGEYLVLDEEEREEQFQDFQEELIDELGLDAFSEYAKDYIINHFVDQDFFDESQEEYWRSYLIDIENEPSEEYENRLIEEITENGFGEDSEYLNYLCEQDSIEWFIDTFGEGVFKSEVVRHDLIDYDEVIDWVSYEDGYSCLATYDGIEIELDNYFAYRVN